MRRAFLIALVAVCGCNKQPATRIIHVKVSADQPFRNRPKWQELVASRFAAANKMFVPMGVRWEVGLTLDWVADQSVPLEKLRHQLSGYIGADTIAVGFVTGPRGDALGAEAPFDPRLLVVDAPDQPEPRNQAILAHQLGHVFGAWDSKDTNSFMHVPPGDGADTTAAEVLRITRGVEFLKGAGGLSPEAAAALQKFWTESKASSGTHPLALYWSRLGEELMSKSSIIEAIEPLSRAVAYQPEDAKLRLSLALALGATKRYPAAAQEFRRASELDPKSALAFSALGGTLANLRKWDEAAAALRKAVELSPNDAQTHANLGMALISTPSKLKEGIAELRIALKLNPDNESAAKALKIAEQRSRDSAAGKQR